MEARSVSAIPVGPNWQYEPKWDGFRCIVFRDNKSVTLQSKSGKPLTRYFPEVVEAVLALKPKQFVLDGELAVPQGPSFSFDALLQRIHPAQSRILRLSKETPAHLVVFDLLSDKDGTPLLDRPLSERRKRLEAFARCFTGPIHLSPATTELRRAREWIKKAGPVLDGIIAKRRDLPYGAGDRKGMQKIKTYRSADCVVGGFRYNEGKDVAGSLLLGLYDDAGLLHHVGFTSAIAAKEKRALTARLKRLRGGSGFTGNAPGGPSRWSTERSSAWEPVRPSLVVEVCYDHFSGQRFRHGTRLLRWRPDKSPDQCTFDQVEQVRGNLAQLLRSR